ncbi:histidinol-phosphatase (PHP family) [Halopelagius inordinatus]|uniref:histidinol-phosphatase n=1 Tax=Halopelagius inordinatus TaxID=553467 RepID=A0A1I2SAF7_9EURY|nr:PHP domain-containing protein [Halopelagius inordinatus]SFG47036.1 histidinol-phosphatase (PHP family) [Halopelagius inordinatus]
MYDYHVHSNYSDGDFLPSMLGAAEAAGLSGVGIADHCVVVPDERIRRFRDAYGFALDQTYPRRRGAIEELRDRFEIEVYDSAEMDYEPDAEAEIRAFLDEAAFDYTVGSVHSLDGTNVHYEEPFAAMSEAERRATVERYFEKVVALAESELFEIAAHVDLVERNAALRGLATEDQYDRVARAFADSRTVPEINAGRVLDDYGEFHPTPALFSALRDAGVEFVVGTDSHAPDEIAARAEKIREFTASTGLSPVELDL